MRVLINCKNNFEARLIVGRLENEGIMAVSLNEHINTLYPFADNADNFAVQVAVNEEDYNRALDIISVDE